jgi:hypothetical protein
MALIANYSYLVIPFLVSVAMVYAENLVEPLPWRDRGVKTGWDLCVLALGILGGIIAEKKGRSDDSIALGMSLFILILIIAFMIGGMRQKKPKTGLHALLSMALGGISLALPFYWVVHSNIGGDK